MIRKVRSVVFGCALLLGLAGYAFAAAAPTGGGEILVVPIEGTVDDGMAHLVERAVAQADADHASALVLDVNTPGGLVSSAFEIRDAMFAAKVPTVAYVSERAYSAGALITLSAEPIPNDPKHVSALRAEFAATAARNHRDPVLAAAMVDKSVAAPNFKAAGAILSLTADEAVRAHFTDAIEPTLADALDAAHVHGTVEHASYTWGELLARFATSPEVSGVLLSIGVLGLIIEIQTLHGIGGAVAIVALGLFFGTHVYAGFSNGIVVALAIAGLLGILFELHVFPGHGVAGTLGALALMTAVVLAFGFAFIFIAVQAISIAIVLSAIFAYISSRLVPGGAFYRRVAFAGVQGPEYVASGDYGALTGRSGVAASFLRPAGVATIDGRRVDVLTEGDFVPAGSPIRVNRVEGARIFVTRINERPELPA